MNQQNPNVGTQSASSIGPGVGGAAPLAALAGLGGLYVGDD
jgi:hypothetical protein